jgi:hypothetical protein
VNAGVVLAGFNDPDSAWPYQGSAPDMGIAEVGSSAQAQPNEMPPSEDSPNPARVAWATLGAAGARRQVGRQASRPRRRIRPRDDTNRRHNRS